MSWRIKKHEFVIKGREYPVHLSIHRVRLPDGTLINSAHEYFSFSAEGSVLVWYRGPTSPTLEVCLYVIDIHSVMGTSLYRFFWKECYGREPEIDEKIHLHGLVPMPEAALPFDPIQAVESFHLNLAVKQKRDG